VNIETKDPVCGCECRLKENGAPPKRRAVLALA
jgi:hypothetical protein